MISFTTGDILTSDAYALVNTVNTVGVMGKGVALHFKEQFPHNYDEYRQACIQKKLMPGTLLVVSDSNLTLGERLIINFPTKVHWRYPSKYSYIEDGLRALVDVIKQYGIKDIAIPPLGCGNGGLDWTQVKSMIVSALSQLDDVNVVVFEPGVEYKSELKQISSTANLTPARAMLLYSLFYYEMSDERTNLVVANKLCFFFQEVGDKSFANIRFSKGHYGPYSPSVAHLLKSVNGKYIHGLEEMDAKPFDDLDLDYSRISEVSEFVHALSASEKRHVSQVLKVIDGFESAFALEILATVAYIRRLNPGISFEDVVAEVGRWSKRKKALFKVDYIRLAYDRLTGTLA